MSTRKLSRQNREIRRVRKAIKHGLKRGLSKIRMEGMNGHLATVLAGRKYEVNEAKALRRAEHKKLVEAKRSKTQTTPKEWVKLVEDIKSTLAPNQ